MVVKHSAFCQSVVQTQGETNFLLDYIHLLITATVKTQDGTNQTISDSCNSWKAFTLCDSFDNTVNGRCHLKDKHGLYFKMF